MTSYESIYEIALSKITDPSLAMFSENDLKDILHNWLMSAIPKFKKCKKDLTNRDENLERFNVDLNDTEKEILAIQIARGWVSGELHNAALTRQVYGGKEEKFYSQAQHISELRAMASDLDIEAKSLNRDYSYENNDYFD